MSTPKSPNLIRGLEKVSEELRQERQKCTIALQDRARQKVENESMKQLLLQYQAELRDNSRKNEILNVRVVSVETVISDLQEELREKEKEIDELRNKLIEKDGIFVVEEQTKSKISNEFQGLVVRNSSLENSLNAQESRLISYEESAVEQKAEIERLRNSNKLLDSRHNDLNNLIATQSTELEKLRNQLKRNEGISEFYQDIESLSAKLRSDLEDSTKKNFDLTTQLREVVQKLNEKTLNEVEQSKLLQTALSQEKILQDQVRDFELSEAELTKRIQIEIKSSAAAKLRAEAAQKGKEFLSEQVNELKAAYDREIENTQKLESLLETTNSSLASLRSELAAVQERASQAETALEKAEGADALAMEVEALRSQLAEVRKQLVKRSIDDEAGATAPHTLIEREQNSRKVF